MNSRKEPTLPNFARLSLEQEPAEMPVTTRSRHKKNLLGGLPEVLQRRIIELILDYAKTELLLSNNELARFRAHAGPWREFVRERQKDREAPCQAIIDLCATSKTAFPFCSTVEFWKDLCGQIPFYKEPPNEKAYKGKEELKYWKRRFDAWCCGRALVDSDEGPYSRDADPSATWLFLARELPEQKTVRIKNEKSNELRRAVREYMMLLVNEGPDAASKEHTLGPIEDWYVEDVTNMSYLFDQQTDIDASEWNREGIPLQKAVDRFNPCLNKWDTSNVKTMNSMFARCENFNNGGKPITFNTSSVEDFSNMFLLCRWFNVPVELKTGKGTEFVGMFEECNVFNQTCKLDTSNAVDVSNMFRSCKSFTNGGKTMELRTGKVKNFARMFQGCNVFNQTCKLDTSNAVDVNAMFMQCSSFNNGGMAMEFTTGKVENFSAMFWYCYVFNQTIKFDFSRAAYFDHMFAACEAFNNGAPANATPETPLVVHPHREDLPVGGIRMEGMFEYCSVFNQTCDFKTSRVSNMAHMFASCTAFNNGGVPFKFDTTRVENFYRMFEDCENLDQPCFAGTHVENMGWQFEQPEHPVNNLILSGMFKGCPKIAAKRGQIVWNRISNPDILFR